MKVLIIFVTLVYFAFSCEECDYPFSNYATCTGETVCVYGAENVQVECWMRDITTDTVIKQLFVEGIAIYYISNNFAVEELKSLKW